MTTPGDVARMLRHANSRPKYALGTVPTMQDGVPSRLRPLYSSQTPRNQQNPQQPTHGDANASPGASPAQPAAMDHDSPAAHSARAGHANPGHTTPAPHGAQHAAKPSPSPHAHALSTRAQSSSSSRSPHPVTPAVMARRRGSQTRVSSFAALEGHEELPVVREYSAGGLIFDELGRVAVIARHSRSGHLEWCLPKGHIEKGETPEQTAVREVHEETGIEGEIVESIATIDYWFTGTTQRIHKLVHHFALRMTGGELTVDGDPDHEAEDVRWIAFDDLDNVLSYPNERRIASMYARKRKNRE
ncbi:NUDIX hydrolase [Pseudoscardovia radai]|uniref:NUDIX hydrolase n=1 Tax=Pseudoscardovia radai TaxID=987066 RepID=A0A261EUN3_9BIFI|nr:NUDIX hydrolase [Pseudoscardovia radai]OZG50569.1 NUDIX hydrolase [Pseudoscardovia radai]